MHRVLIVVLLASSTLKAMRPDAPAKLRWASPQAESLHDHPLIESMQKESLYCAKQVELVRSQLEEKPASQSRVESLDLADGRSRAQHALKLKSLVRAHAHEDPRRALLQETLFSAGGIELWYSLLVKDPATTLSGKLYPQNLQFAQVIDCDKCHMGADGSVIVKMANELWQVVPRDCNWSTITSDQLCCIYLALERSKQNNPLNLSDDMPAHASLRTIFKSLDPYMQNYVARACSIKHTIQEN